ncbi:hypothetical protein HDU67_004109, partial [Dinochytrium kinnereticum]
MSSLFSRFSKFRKQSRSSSSPDLTSQQSSSSADNGTRSRKPMSAEQAAIQKAEVVIMVNGVAGPKAIVPLITTTLPSSLSRQHLSPSPLAPPAAGARLPISPDSPAAPSPKSVTVPLKTRPLVSETTLVPSNSISLLELPNELLSTIAMKAGFFAATTLMLTCKRLK